MGMTDRIPCRQSIVSGMRMVLKSWSLILVSPSLQITIGLPPRATTCCRELNDFYAKKQSGGDNEPWGAKQSTRRGKGYIMNGVLCKNKDDGAVFVNQSQRSVLQLSGENAFAVKICELLDFLLTERNNQEMNGVPKYQKEKKKKKKERKKLTSAPSRQVAC